MSDWFDFLYDSGVLQTGSFRLKSGKESPYFLNFGRIDSGKTLAEMGRFFAEALVELKPDLLFGPAYKGLPMAVATVQEYARLTGLDLPYGSFRKEAKTHGDSGMTLGRAPSAGARIVMIDDVITTSATKLEAIEEINAFLGAKANIVGVIVGVDRLERTPEGKLYSEDFAERTGIPVHALSTTRQVMDTLHQRGRIDAPTYERCLGAL